MQRTGWSCVYLQSASSISCDSSSPSTWMGLFFCFPSWASRHFFSTALYCVVQLWANVVLIFVQESPKCFIKQRGSSVLSTLLQYKHVRRAFPSREYCACTGCLVILETQWLACTCKTTKARQWPFWLLSYGWFCYIYTVTGSDQSDHHPRTYQLTRIKTLFWGLKIESLMLAWWYAWCSEPVMPDGLIPDDAWWWCDDAWRCTFEGFVNCNFLIPPKFTFFTWNL